MPLLTSLLTGIELPFLHRVTRHIPDDGLSDIPRSVRDALNASGVAERLLPNGEVAIGVGSRGIAGLPQIVRATVDWFRERGARPFLVPCMGSHGGATAEGQLRVLEHLGVTAASAGCPIRAGMDTIVIGTLDNGLPVHMDTHATSADGVFVINRVKPHTAFTGPHESGLVKMLVIGLGKRNGADCCHSLGFGRFAEVMPQMARLLLERKPSLLGGLAVVENAHDRVCLLEAVLPERLLERDQALLVEARARMGSLPVDDLDVLLVDRMGKDISGSGMDPNITGRSPSPYKTGGLKAIFAKALEELEDMSGAKVGDKTMMDALIPASEAVAAYTGDSADELFDAAAQAAAQGAEATKQYVSKFGRAKSYGTKTIGTPDAGAVSMSWFFQGLARE